MDILENDVIVLSDDNSYLVVRKIQYNMQTFYYVADIKNHGIVKFLYECGNQLIEVEDENLLENIINEVLKTIDFNELMLGIQHQLNKSVKNQE